MNLQDYAFLQNMIDCHDKGYEPLGRFYIPIYTDVRNYYQSMLEMGAFQVARPKIGTRYGMYMKLHKADYFCNYSFYTLQNWMGERFPLIVEMGNSWSRTNKYGERRVYQTIYATNSENGEKWRGIWPKDWQDLVIMRRLA